MAKLPHCSGKEIMNALLKEGFVIKRQKGSHATLYQQKEGKVYYVTIPIHGNKELLPKTLLSILRQAGMTREKIAEIL